MDAQTTLPERAGSIGELPIRQLIDVYPETMVVLDHYGLDMCCAGAHTLAEAARLHGLDADAVIQQVADAIQHDQH